MTFQPIPTNRLPTTQSFITEGEYEFTKSCGKCKTEGFLFIEYEYTPPSQGLKGEYGQPLEPDDDGGFEILVCDPVGKEENIFESLDLVTQSAILDEVREDWKSYFE